MALAGQQGEAHMGMNHWLGKWPWIGVRRHNGELNVFVFWWHIRVWLECHLGIGRVVCASIRRMT